MKTVEDLNRLIRDEITAIEALRSEDEKIWSVGGGNGSPMPNAARRSAA